jgi:DNA modification methylase
MVLDPLAGSGSTLLAAKVLGRSYFGIELDREYHAIASGRLRQNI